MSDVPQGPGWWQASDAKWYPPESFPGAPATPAAPPGPATPPGPGGPFGNQPTIGYGYPLGAAPPKTEPLAIWSLVLSIVGLVLVCCYIGLAGTIAGAITGYLGRKKIRESNGALTGDGMALAGLIIGAVGTGLGVLLIVLNIVTSTASFWVTST